MMTWKATNNVTASIFYTKNDEAKKVLLLDEVLSSITT